MGLKEYKCHKCQKKFTRMKDKTYHEKTVVKEHVKFASKSSLVGSNWPDT